MHLRIMLVVGGWSIIKVCYLMTLWYQQMHQMRVKKQTINYSNPNPEFRKEEKRTIHETDQLTLNLEKEENHNIIAHTIAHLTIVMNI